MITRRQGVIGAFMIAMANAMVKMKAQSTEHIKILPDTPKFGGTLSNEAALYLVVERSEKAKDMVMSLVMMDVFDYSKSEPKNPVYAMIVRYKGKEAKISMDEVMEALGGH